MECQDAKGNEDKELDNNNTKMEVEIERIECCKECGQVLGGEFCEGCEKCSRAEMHVLGERSRSSGVEKQKGMEV